MATGTEARPAGVAGRTPLVVTFVVVQAVAFVTAYSLGRPAWYAVFAVFSVSGVAYAHEAGRPTVRTGLRFLAAHGLAAAGALLVGVAVPVVLSLVFGVSDLGIPVWFVAYVAFATFGTAAAVEDGGFTVLVATLGSVVVLALGLPLFMFVARQSPALVLETALDPDVHRVLYLGVYGPLLAAVFSLLFGVPLAYLLAEGFGGQQFVESLVDLPLVVPHSVAGILVLFGFGRGGAFPELSVLGTMVGMVLAMAFVSAPYAVNTTREAFETIDDRLEYASRIHGANQWETFRRVTGPLAVRGMVTGGVLAWARAVSEFGAVAVVAYSVEFFYPLAWDTVRAQHAPVFVYNTYLQGGLEESGAVAFLLLAVSAVIFLAVRYLTDGGTLGGGMSR
jgi:molybdate/tungstate transport system permease protein